MVSRSTTPDARILCRDRGTSAALGAWRGNVPPGWWWWGGAPRRWDRGDPALLSPCSAGSGRRAACRGTRPACSTPGSTARPHAERGPPEPRRARRPGSSRSPPGTGGTPSERHLQPALRMERGDGGPKASLGVPAGPGGGSGVPGTARTWPGAEPVEARLAATRVLPQHEAAVLLRDALRGGGGGGYGCTAGSSRTALITPRGSGGAAAAR